MLFPKPGGAHGGSSDQGLGNWSRPVHTSFFREEVEARPRVQAPSLLHQLPLPPRPCALDSMCLSTVLQSWQHLTALLFGGFSWTLFLWLTNCSPTKDSQIDVFPQWQCPWGRSPCCPKGPEPGQAPGLLPGEKGRERSRGSLFIPWVPGETKSKESQVHEGRRAPFPATGRGTLCSGSTITLPTQATYTYQKAKQSFLRVLVALHGTLHPLLCM